MATEKRKKTSDSQLFYTLSRIQRWKSFSYPSSHILWNSCIRIIWHLNKCQFSYYIYLFKIIFLFKIVCLYNNFKYLGSLLTNQNSIQEEIKCRLRAGNSCYYSVQTFLSTRFLSKNLKIKICKTIVLPVVLYGCETWSLVNTA